MVGTPDTLRDQRKNLDRIDMIYRIERVHILIRVSILLIL
jgi:hypothetical protein